MPESIIDTTVAFVKETLRNAEGGHDWHHIERVWNMAKHIGTIEGNADMLTVELGALLHDIADSKFHNGDEDIGPNTARKFLEAQNVEKTIVEGVVDIIKHISFKGNLAEQAFMSPELAITQDADRLDAIGAVGIARAFSYGGHTGRAMYDPTIPPRASMTKEEYKSSSTPTINHFYEKLLLLKDRMNTETGKKIALERHRYMEAFLQEFYAEAKGER